MLLVRSSTGFASCPPLRRSTSTGFGRCLLTKRFTRFCRCQPSPPPYPTWPVSDAALDESVDYTPRALMQAGSAHRDVCLRSGTLTEMTSLRQEEVTEPEPLHDDPGLTALDRRFDELIAVADPAAVLDPTTEDTRVPELLMAGLAAWVDTLPGRRRALPLGRQTGQRALIFMRGCVAPSTRTGAQQSWSFQKIASGNAVKHRHRLTGPVPRLGPADSTSGDPAADSVAPPGRKPQRVHRVHPASFSWSADDIRI